MNTLTPSVWTDAKIVRLRELWMQGLSASKIGQQLLVSKSAVLGKVHRLDLPSRSTNTSSANLAAVVTQPIADSPPVPSAADEPAIPPQSEPPAEAVQPMLLPEIEPVTSSQSEASRTPSTPRLSSRQSCQWPNGDPGRSGFRLCGDPALLDKPYCAVHCKRAYVLRFSRANPT